jgi:hypothetical protein
MIKSETNTRSIDDNVTFLDAKSESGEESQAEDHALRQIGRFKISHLPLRETVVLRPKGMCSGCGGVVVTCELSARVTGPGLTEIELTWARRGNHVQ